MIHPSLRPISDELIKLLLTAYVLIQKVIVWLFTPRKPSNLEARQLKNGKIAVIGGGLSGIAAAAHSVAHGWDVVIFEHKDHVGGIWAEVNETSGLQLHSLMYRFFPDLVWSEGYPHKGEIVGNIERIWKQYKLEQKTRFGVDVQSVDRIGKKNDDDPTPSQWIINKNDEEVFDAVIVAIGTCGKPTLAKFKDDDKFKGKIVHSSDLDGLDVKGKNVIVIGGGASAVEAVELAVQKGATHTELLTRSDKWIVPRNIFFEAFLSMFPGREIFLSHLPEWFLRRYFYREFSNLTPKYGIHTSTPVVNSEFLEHFRTGRASYRRGVVVHFTETGVLYAQRDSSDQYMLKAHGSSTPKEIAELAKTNGGNGNFSLAADVIVLATGFTHPVMEQKFIPKHFLPDHFSPPNIYMQVFSVCDPSLMLLNCTYKNAIATAGHIHLGIYTRIMLTFLGDPTTAPYPELMRLWVRFINLWKTENPSSVTALAFITYFELLLWFGMFFVFNPLRLKYLPFVLFGWKSGYLQKSAGKRQETSSKMKMKTAK